MNQACTDKLYGFSKSASRKLLSLSVGLALALSSIPAFAQTVDYSVVFVPEESNLELMKVTRESDYVCLPPVKRSSDQISWLTNRILAVSPNGNDIAYLSLRNGYTNIFVKSADRQGASRQRTNRTAVVDFTYSPDGSQLCFTEAKGNSNQLFLTDALNGYVCKQITSDSQDYSPVYSPDMKNIFFTRLESLGATVWSYDVQDKFLLSYTTGMNPYPIKDDNSIYVARTSCTGNGEIWKINIETGVEECVLSDPYHSFYSPMLSPAGDKLLVVGSTNIPVGKSGYWNTDLYTCDIDGTDLRQITHHAADDLSPVWSADGRYIYFISQRGNPDGLANVWRLTYKD